MPDDEGLGEGRPESECAQSEYPDLRAQVPLLGSASLGGVRPEPPDVIISTVDNGFIVRIPGYGGIPSFNKVCTEEHAVLPLVAQAIEHVKVHTRANKEQDLMAKFQENMAHLRPDVDTTNIKEKAVPMPGQEE